MMMTNKTKIWPFQSRPLSILFFILIFTSLLGRPDRCCSGIRFSDKRHSFDWEALVNEEEAAAIRRLMKLQEYSSGNLRELDDFDVVDDLIRPTRRPKKIKVSDSDTDAAIDRISQINENHGKQPSIVNGETVGRTERLQTDLIVDSADRNKQRNDILFLIIVGTCSLIGILGLIAAVIFWYKIQKRAEAAIESDYPSYGFASGHAGTSKSAASSAMSDRKLAQSAQMFHYQQQRQQMMAQEKAHLDARPVHSDDSDDEMPAGNDYTVYECPGLAPTGEMEVRNPLFSEPDTPYDGMTSHPTTNSHYPQLSSTPTTSSSSPPKEKSLS